jgi:hypothetical protein
MINHDPLLTLHRSGCRALAVGERDCNCSPLRLPRNHLMRTHGQADSNRLEDYWSLAPTASEVSGRPHNELHALARAGQLRTMRFEDALFFHRNDVEALRAKGPGQ